LLFVIHRTPSLGGDWPVLCPSFFYAAIIPGQFNPATLLMPIALRLREKPMNTVQWECVYGVSGQE
jgi:hypothetical protein